MHSQETQQTALEKAAAGEQLTPEEVEALREVLRGWQVLKAWGRLGKIFIWFIITLGAISAAAREIRNSQWFGQ
jgi:hypothetical protein